MKQHISIDQINELSDKAKKKLREWWKPRDGDLFSDGDWYPSLIWITNKDEEEYEGSFYRCNLESKLMFDKDQLYEDLDNPENNEDAAYKAYPLLSIGQMVEFLQIFGCNIFNNDPDIGDEKQMLQGWGWVIKSLNPQMVYKEAELCDALWEAVKHILQKE